MQKRNSTLTIALVLCFLVVWTAARTVKVKRQTLHSPMLEDDDDSGTNQRAPATRFDFMHSSENDSSSLSYSSDHNNRGQMMGPTVNRADSSDHMVGGGGTNQDSESSDSETIDSKSTESEPRKTAPKVTTTTTTAPPAGLLCTSDVVFALDQSTSINRRQWGLTRLFSALVVRDLRDFGQANGTRVGLIKFSDNSTVVFDLNKHSVAQDAADEIMNTTSIGGLTNTGAALQHMRDLFDQGRPNVEKIGVLITDGNALNATAALSAAQQLHRTGAHVAVIAIGTGLNFNLLQQLASTPNLFKRVASFDELNQLKSDIDNIVCR